MPRTQIPRLWLLLRSGVREYRQKAKHFVPGDAVVVEDWQSPDGDEVFAFAVDGSYGGFLVFKVQDILNERWGTVGMIYVVPEHRESGALKEAFSQLAEVLRERDCDVMNFMTDRRAAERFGPDFGFHPRTVEWVKEL